METFELNSLKLITSSKFNSSTETFRVTIPEYKGTYPRPEELAEGFINLLKELKKDTNDYNHRMCIEVLYNTKCISSTHFCKPSLLDVCTVFTPVIEELMLKESIQSLKGKLYITVRVSKAGRA
jgi:hypothetical protein